MIKRAKMDRTSMCMNEQFDRIERMLKWLIAENLINDGDVLNKMKLQAACSQPDISDIFEEE